MGSVPINMFKTNIDPLLAKADALIFDCDGTLIETAPLYARAWASGFWLLAERCLLIGTKPEPAYPNMC